MLSEMSFMEPHVRHNDKDSATGAAGGEQPKIQFEVVSEEEDSCYVLNIKADEGQTYTAVDVQKKYAAGSRAQAQEQLEAYSSVDEGTDLGEEEAAAPQQTPGNSSAHTDQ